MSVLDYLRCFSSIYLPKVPEDDGPLSEPQKFLSGVCIREQDVREKLAELEGHDFYDTALEMFK